MCDRHLNGGPLVCEATAADEFDGHTHQYASATGSFVGNAEKDHG